MANTGSKTKKSTELAAETAVMPTPAKRSAADIKRGFELQEREERFAAAKSEVQLVDLSKTESRTFTTFSKDKLRTYLKNPFSNQTNIRALSRYLYRMSQPYRRLIWYNAEMIDLNMRAVIPSKFSLTETNDAEETKKEYFDTITQLRKMDLANEMLKLLIVAWREDAAYGVVYEDDSGFFILPMDGDYCKVSSINYDGTFNFAFDLSYFRSHQQQLLYYGDPFTKMYNTYIADPTQRWQEVDPTRSICIKVNNDDATMSLPPYVAMFNSIIDLCDLAEIQSVKDSLSIYKLLVARLQPLKNSEEPDNFEVDLSTAIEYYNKLAAALPDEVAACISPLPIEPIEFADDSTKEVSQIATATKNLFNASGGGQILNSATITGSTAFSAAIAADTDYALSSLLPQIERWTNRYLTGVLGDHSVVKYLNVSEHTKADYAKILTQNATYGLPNRLAMNSIAGFSELDTLSMQFLEIDVLALDKVLMPVQSTHTASATSTAADPVTGGAPTKTAADGLTDAGDASRTTSDTAN